MKIVSPKIIQACGNLPKKIEEYIGKINTGNKDISIARMISPKGWVEPGQTPEFSEYTVVLKGTLVIETKKGTETVKAGQAFISMPNEWVKYSTPDEGAEYVAVCIPAFSPETVHRD